MDFFEQIGKVALGTRVRFLGEKISADAAQIYRLYGIEMNPKWFPVFYVLSQATEKTITSIASEIGHSHASVSKIAGEMKRAGLLTEKTSREDRRRTMVALSAEGKKIARKIETQYQDVKSAIEELSAQAAHDLWKALKEWEYLLAQKSLLSRVSDKKKMRESSAVEIVPYQAKYRSAFRSLNEEWIKKYFKMEQPDYDALDHPQEYILDKKGFIFVALVSDKPVGVCALIHRKDKKFPLELAKMAVAPDQRGKNIGWLLGRAVIEKARQLKAERLFLESNTVLKPAIGLYHKLGFKKIVGPQTPYDRCNIQMSLDL